MISTKPLRWDGVQPADGASSAYRPEREHQPGAVRNRLCGIQACNVAGSVRHQPLVRETVGAEKQSAVWLHRHEPQILIGENDDHPFIARTTGETHPRAT